MIHFLTKEDLSMNMKKAILMGILATSMIGQVFAIPVYIFNGTANTTLKVKVDVAYGNYWAGLEVDKTELGAGMVTVIGNFKGYSDDLMHQRGEFANADSVGRVTIAYADASSYRMPRGMHYSDTKVYETYSREIEGQKRHNPGIMVFIWKNEAGKLESISFYGRVREDIIERKYEFEGERKELNKAAPMIDDIINNALSQKHDMSQKKKSRINIEMIISNLEKKNQEKEEEHDRVTRTTEKTTYYPFLYKNKVKEIIKRAYAAREKIEEALAPKKAGFFSGWW